MLRPYADYFSVLELALQEGRLPLHWHRPPPQALLLMLEFLIFNWLEVSTDFWGWTPLLSFSLASGPLSTYCFVIALFCNLTTSTWLAPRGFISCWPNKMNSSLLGWPQYPDLWSRLSSTFYCIHWVISSLLSLFFQLGTFPEWNLVDA